MAWSLGARAADGVVVGGGWEDGMVPACGCEWVVEWEWGRRGGEEDGWWSAAG